jgi:cytochrome c peroxidase
MRLQTLFVSAWNGQKLKFDPSLSDNYRVSCRPNHPAAPRHTAQHSDWTAPMGQTDARNVFIKLFKIET